VLASLRTQGVDAAVHYPTPIHHQPAFRRFGDAVSCPNAERLSRSVISLPLYPGITPGQIERCVEALAIALGRAA
jgi:dTDP-4-amino-4,6-dideoxygalactose transaminase